MSDTLKFEIKPFKQLSGHEVYESLRLRSDVFVVEQNCVYSDIDGKDRKALHVLGTSNSIMVAYARLFAPGDYFENASIGRVAVVAAERQNGYGHELLKRCISAVSDVYGNVPITISAQKYLQSFYEAHGFTTEGEEYLEDGIPHIQMLRPTSL